MDVAVTAWICPTPGCGNFYASSSAGNLRQSFNKKPFSQTPTFPRSRCPDCRARGVDVDRVPVELVAVL